MHKYDLNLREYWRIIKRQEADHSLYRRCHGRFQFYFRHIGQTCPHLQNQFHCPDSKNASLVGAYANVQLTGASNAMETQTYVIKSYYMLELPQKEWD